MFTANLSYNTGMEGETLKLALGNIEDIAKANPGLNARQIKEWASMETEMRRLAVGYPGAEHSPAGNLPPHDKQRISLKFL